MCAVDPTPCSGLGKWQLSGGEATGGDSAGRRRPWGRTRQAPGAREPTRPRSAQIGRTIKLVDVLGLEQRLARVSELALQGASGGLGVLLSQFHQNGLSSGGVGKRAVPGLQNGGLEGAAVREAEAPGVCVALVDLVEVASGQGLGLAAGQEHYAGESGGHRAAKRAGGEEPDRLRGWLLLAVNTLSHHVGLEEGALEQHLVVAEGLEDGGQHALRHLGAHLDGVVAVGQNLGLDDGHQAVLLADGGVAGQGMRSLQHGQVGWLVLGHVDRKHRTPLGEARARIVVLLAPFGQAVQASGADLLVGVGDGHEALVDLDAGKDALGVQQLNHALAARRLLEERLLEQNAARDVLPQPLGGEQHGAVLGAVLLSVLDAHVVEALFDGARALVSGEDALAGCGKEARILGQFLGTFLR
ncbi:amino acid adenylation domain-containing protein [Babesia caballi]|uniref:Amino acid adenylation domain-containing protein n=1 Tax=Babesia caballi TaxID=5871 RepID=A0AAV4M384_BABCB|nr:amino acid adenylation domain-containing protein [Babesia caballi]